MTSGRGVRLRLLGYDHAFYDGRPLGTLGDWGLATGSERLALTMGQLARAYTPDGTIADLPGLPPYLLVGDAVPADGLRAEYFDDTVLGQRALERPETTVDQAWGGCAPDPVLTPGAFSVRWTGTVNPRYSESYTFTADCEGAIRVWIDGAIVLDEWAATAGGASTPVSLTADRAAELTVEFKATGIDAHARLLWSSSSQAREPLPQGRLAPPPWPVRWGPGYVDEQYVPAFRAALPSAAAGYTYHRADASHFDGYYQATRCHYDVQDDPSNGRGLLRWEQDALGHRTTVTYDEPFNLLPIKVTDAAKLIRSATYDYRVLMPRLLVDANGNQTALGYTPLGLPAWIAVMGKAGEQIGDTRPLRHVVHLRVHRLRRQPRRGAPARLGAHDQARRARLDADRRRGADARTATDPAGDRRASTAQRARPHPERFIQRREHSDGFGRLLQAETRPTTSSSRTSVCRMPPRRSARSSCRQDPATPRVVLGGWQAYDNKGRVVEQWEPFFDQGYDYAPPTAARLTGELRKDTTYYDPRGLAVRTVHPDGSQQRVVGIPATRVPADLTDPGQYTPTPWETYTYDQNDDAGRTDPNGSHAWKAQWNTPSSALQDALGRVIASIRRTTDNAPL